MNASKENARKSLIYLDMIRQCVKGHLTTLVPPNPIDFLQQFLDAAERKLPSEASFAKARKAQGEEVMSAVEKAEFILRRAAAQARTISETKQCEMFWRFIANKSREIANNLVDSMDEQQEAEEFDRLGKEKK